jgi:hypothetical protein
VSNVETSNENDRIGKQLVARRDLLLPIQPKVTRLNALVMQIFKLQLWFCGAVLVLGSVFPTGARLLAAAVSPIAQIVFLIYPSYPLRDGPLGSSFCQSVIGESFFVVFVILCLYQTVYIARYWRCPWRFNEFYMEQLGVRRSVLSAVVTGGITTAVAVLIGAILCHWYGFTDFESSTAMIKPYQLALWCYMMLAAALTFVLTFSLAVSSAAAAIRRLFLYGVESGRY